MASNYQLTYNVDIVFVIDVIGSMDNVISNGKRQCAVFL